MANKRFGSVQGLVARATRLSECGEVVPGATGMATSGFVNIELSANIDEGEEFQVKLADGTYCINEKECPALSWYEWAAEFCQVDPQFFELLSAINLITDVAGDSVGYQLTDDRICTNAGFEVWTKVAGTACGAGGECSPSNSERWIYWLLPWATNGIIGDETIENATTSFSMSGNTKGNPNWGQGPYNVVNLAAEGAAVPGPLADDPVLTNAHLYKRLTSIAPPAKGCGFETLTPVPPVDLGSS